MEPSTEFFQRVRLPGDPQGRPASVVVCGEARFTVLTARLLRLEWSPTATFTDVATFAFPNRRAGAPTSFEARVDGGWLRIETEALTLAYRVDSGRFTPENLAITFRMGGVSHSWRPAQRDEANLGGTRRTLDMTGGEVPLEPGLISRAGWTVFDDSAAVALQSEDGWVGACPAGSVVDWYFFGYGHAYTDAMAEYTQFGGAAPLVPRYALGVWWSRFWPYSAADLERLVDEFAAHTLPLDVLVVDMDWHLPDHWTGYTWNPALFPDLEAFLAEMHARGLRVTLNLHPAEGVRAHEAAYPAFAQALGLADDGEHGVRAPIPFRITDRQFARLYFALLHHPLEEQGVDFWWIDWQQGESSEIEGLDPLLWLNHLHFADARRRGQRPLLFSRWGGLGNHRYPIGFSGDTFGGWPTLAALPHFTASAANVGFGWWSHDIGGHFGAVDAELFTRWTQFGALSPCLRLHAVKHILAERRPWAFPARALNAIRSGFELRYALVPYLYTMARHTYERGLALCRPMYYAYPEEESAYLARGQYQLGDDLIAAPVTTPADPETGLATQDVWIPPGTWYAFARGEAYVGPRWVRISADLETIPLFARAGAIIPTAQPAPHLVDVPQDWLDLRVFPGADGAFRLYEDDGASQAYTRGDAEWTTFSVSGADPDEVTIRVHPAEGQCASLPERRGYSVTFVAVDRPEEVVDECGEPLDWRYDMAERMLCVTVPPRSRHEAATAIVRRSRRQMYDAPPETDSAVSAPPFAHVIAYTASDEARRSLAHALLVPPYGTSAAERGQRGTPVCAAEVLWRNVSAAGVTVIRHAMSDLTTETPLTAPFAADRALQPHRWEVTARFTVGDETVTTTTRGPCVNPPIQRWRVRYGEQAQWRDFQADPDARLTVTEPYDVALDAQIAATAVARATIDLAAPITLWLDTWTTGTLALWVDGRALETGAPQPTLAGLARPWPVERFGPVALSAGRHVIEAQLTAPEAGPWVFGALLVDESGEPVARCAHADDV